MIWLRDVYTGHLFRHQDRTTITFLMCSLAGVTTGFDIVRQHNGVPRISATGGHRPGTITKSFVSTIVSFWRMPGHYWQMPGHDCFHETVVDVSCVWI